MSNLNWTDADFEARLGSRGESVTFPQLTVSGKAWRVKPEALQNIPPMKNLPGGRFCLLDFSPHPQQADMLAALTAYCEQADSSRNRSRKSTESVSRAQSTDSADSSKASE